MQYEKSAFNNPDAVARLVEILLARGARTILWGGAVSPREHLLEDSVCVSESIDLL